MYFKGLSVAPQVAATTVKYYHRELITSYPSYHTYLVSIRNLRVRGQAEPESQPNLALTPFLTVLTTRI